jgi:hypothetical protein
MLYNSKSILREGKTQHVLEGGSFLGVNPREETEENRIELYISEETFMTQILYSKFKVIHYLVIALAKPYFYKYEVRTTF